MSGESSKVKLTQLIEAGVFLVGDVWRFGYVYGKGPDRISIDKEVRVRKQYIECSEDSLANFFRRYTKSMTESLHSSSLPASASFFVHIRSPPTQSQSRARLMAMK